MTFPFVRRATPLGALGVLAASALLAGCAVPAKPPAQDPQSRAPTTVPAPVPVVPVEAEPKAPATQPAINFIASTYGQTAAALAYADKLRTMSSGQLGAEINRLGDPGDVPLAQIQLGLALAQTRNLPELARAQGLMQRVATNTTTEGQDLAPLARLLASRYGEQRRVEEDRDKQAQQVRDSQRRIDQLTERLEALRAIERSFSRPSHVAPVPSAAPPNGAAKP